MSDFQGKTILITGGTGSFGHTFLDYLLKTEFKEIRIFSRDELKQELMRTELNNPKIKFYVGDIRDRDSVDDAMKNVDCVFHMAAQARIQPSIIDPASSFENNVLGTFNVLLACRENNVEKFIYSASSSAYGLQENFPLKEDYFLQRD